MSRKYRAPFKFPRPRLFVLARKIKSSLNFMPNISSNLGSATTVANPIALSAIPGPVIVSGPTLRTCWVFVSKTESACAITNIDDLPSVPFKIADAFPCSSISGSSSPFSRNRSTVSRIRSSSLKVGDGISPSKTASVRTSVLNSFNLSI